MFTSPTHNDNFLRVEIADRRARLQREVLAGRRVQERLRARLRFRHRTQHDRRAHRLAQRYA